MASRTISALRRTSRDDMPGSPDWVDPFLQNVNEFQDQAVSRLGDLGAARQYTKVVDFVHGVEKRIRSPLPPGVKCTGVKAVASRGVTLVDGVAKGSSYALRCDGDVLWRPLQTNSNEPAQLGITVMFDLKHGEPCLEMANSGNQTIPHNAANPYDNVTFDTTLFSRGSVITYSSGVFSFGEPGTYHVDFRFRWEQGKAYTDAEIWFDKNNTGNVVTSRWPFWQMFPINTTDGASDTLAGKITVASSDTMRVKAFQTNASVGSPANNRFIYGANSAGTTIRISRLFNDSTPTGRVTLHFFGDR